MELWDLLITQKNFIETLKSHYKTLKDEYIGLELAYDASRGEGKELLADREAQQENFKLVFAGLQRELRDRNAELVGLRKQAMSPCKEELLRAQMQQETEAPFRQRLKALQEEADKRRCESGEVRCELVELSARLQCEREESARLLEERSVLHGAELTCLRKEKEELAAQRERDLERVERDDLQLRTRLKVLQAELTELHAQRSGQVKRAESAQRLHAREQAASRAAQSSAEAKLKYLRDHLERTKGELHNRHEDNNWLGRRVNEAEGEVSALTSQIESLKCSHETVLTNMRLEHIRSKGALETERDALQRQVDGLQAALKEREAAVAQKERETLRKVEAARQDEALKAVALHHEKLLKLEERYSALKHEMALVREADDTQSESWEKRLHRAKRGEALAREELQKLRGKLQQQSQELHHAGKELSAARVEAEQLKQRDAQLQHRCKQLEEKLQKASVAEKERKEFAKMADRKHQNNVQLLEAKMEDLRLEVYSANRRSSDRENPQRGRRWQESSDKSKVEAQRLLLLDGPTLRASSPKPLPAPLPKEPISTEALEERRRSELPRLRRRLDELRRTP